MHASEAQQARPDTRRKPPSWRSLIAGGIATLGLLAGCAPIEAVSLPTPPVVEPSATETPYTEYLSPSLPISSTDESIIENIQCDSVNPEYTYYKQACDVIDDIKKFFTPDEVDAQILDNSISNLHFTDYSILDTTCDDLVSTQNSIACVRGKEIFLDINGGWAELPHEYFHLVADESPRGDVLSVNTENYTLFAYGSTMTVYDNTGNHTYVINGEVPASLFGGMVSYLETGEIVPVSLPYFSTEMAIIAADTAKSMINWSVSEKEAGNSRDYLLHPTRTQRTLEEYLNSMGEGDKEKAIAMIVEFNNDIQPHNDIVP